MQVMAIDHGHCFGHTWNSQSIQAAASQISVVCRQDFIPFLASSSPFEPYLDRLLNVTITMLQEALADIPPEWGATESEAEALVDFLLSRRQPVAEAIRARFQSSGE